MKKRDNRSLSELSNSSTEEVGRAKLAVRRLIIIVLGTAASYVAYIFLTERTTPLAATITLWVYLLLTAGFISAFVIYNRGFTMVNRTPESFPEEWSAERRCAVIAEGVRRRDKSKWMLLVILPLVLTFLIDMLDLYVLSGLLDLFGE